MDPALLVQHFLLYFILPLWLLAGLTDYFLHRRTQIERTSGTKESVLHALQLGEAGIPVVLGLLYDINAMILGIMLIALATHEATAIWDVTYAHTRRYIGPLEQHVHSFLELLPLMAVSFVIVLHWDQFLALFGLGTQPAQLGFHLKASPLSPFYIATLFCSIAVFILVPYAEELWRCITTAQDLHTMPEAGTPKVRSS
ncbi:MAG: hypothetical protein QM706_07905 [Nitrospira sp.]